MLDLHSSRSLIARLNAPAFSKLTGTEFEPPVLKSNDPDQLGAARGLAVAIVLSMPFWTVLIWVGHLLTR